MRSTPNAIKNCDIELKNGLIKEMSCYKYLGINFKGLKTIQGTVTHDGNPVDRITLGTLKSLLVNPVISIRVKVLIVKWIPIPKMTYVESILDFIAKGT